MRIYNNTKFQDSIDNGLNSFSNSSLSFLLFVGLLSSVACEDATLSKFEETCEQKIKLYKACVDNVVYNENNEIIRPDCSVAEQAVIDFCEEESPLAGVQMALKVERALVSKWVVLWLVKNWLVRKRVLKVE